jgi:hypothetical protein
MIYDEVSVVKMKINGSFCGKKPANKQGKGC